MRLTKIDIQGFKTFANKTTIIVPEPMNGRFSFTAIVGPNGSGKSNIADAIRWCLGEQSAKLLRAKSAQDVIFSGSHNRARVGFAEVSLTFDNTSGAFPVDFSEVVITRRLFRDGESAYLLNSAPVRVHDLHVMLAHAGVGVRSYTVIGQGMIDDVLLSSPQDRKAFFDDATGVRGLFLERHQASLRLQRAAVNLQEVERLCAELLPRVQLLERQVKKFHEREEAEANYVRAAERYFGGAYAYYAQERERSCVRGQEHDAAIMRMKGEIAALDAQIEMRARDAQEITQQASDIQKTAREAAAQKRAAFTQAQERMFAARGRLADIERDIAVARVRVAHAPSTMPTAQILAALEEVTREHQEIVELLTHERARDMWQEIVARSVDLLKRCRELWERVKGAGSRGQGAEEGPNPEEIAKREALAQARVEVEREVAACAAAEKVFLEAHEAIQHVSASTKPDHDMLALVQRVRHVQQELSVIQGRASEEHIIQAKAETHTEDILVQAREAGVAEALLQGYVFDPTFSFDDARGALERARRRYQDVGAIDPAVVEEFSVARERSDFLQAQITDLQQAIAHTREVILRLDKDIHARGDSAFAALEEAFEKYFTVLFGGGTCRLVRVRGEDKGERAKGEGGDEGGEDEETGLDDMVPEAEYDGVDIEVTPPLKRQKSLALLSGGERALVSIALLCAIIETHPSPFVVLDEVDAALDEVNTLRFAKILRELSEKTQFIAITHSRSTMEQADALYGVALNDDATSRLLSVKLETQSAVSSL